MGFFQRFCPVTCMDSHFGHISGALAQAENTLRGKCPSDLHHVWGGLWVSIFGWQKYQEKNFFFILIIIIIYIPKTCTERKMYEVYKIKSYFYTWRNMGCNKRKVAEMKNIYLLCSFVFLHLHKLRVLLVISLLALQQTVIGCIIFYKLKKTFKLSWSVASNSLVRPKIWYVCSVPWTDEITT